MIRFLKYIFMYPVLLLIMLHTFIPHAFSNSLPVTNHVEIHKESHHNLLGLFGLIFHEKHEKNLHDLNTFQVKVLNDFSKPDLTSLFHPGLQEIVFFNFQSDPNFHREAYHHNLMSVLNLLNWRGPPC